MWCHVVMESRVVSRDCQMWCHVMMESRDIDYSIYGVATKNGGTAGPFYILLTFHVKTVTISCYALSPACRAAPDISTKSLLSKLI